MDTVTVNIYGEDYTVKSGDDPEYIKEVARVVDERMRQIAGSGKVVTTSKIAILAALNITDELYKARLAQKEKEEATDRRIEKLMKKLEGALR